MNDIVAEPKKSLGQHWLEDELTLEKIVSLANLVKDKDTVLEIGPGLGSLTKLLVKKAKHVLAIELDDNLSSKLKKSLNNTNLEIVNADILSFDLGNLPTDYKIVANIPYYLTSNLIRVLSGSTNSPSLVVLLVQKEVAERIAAKPGSLSILGVTAQYYWETKLSDIVPARLFTPPPRVDSQIIVLKRRISPLFTGLNEKDFFRLVKIGFSAKRKTLENSVANGLRGPKNQITKAIEDAGIDPKIRAQNLELSEWHQLYKSFVAKKLI